MTFPAADLVAVGTDPDGNPLSVTAVGPISTNGGMVVLNSGMITYTSATNYVGADEFSYTLSDNYGGTAIGTVQVTVVADDEHFNRISYPSTIGSGTVMLNYQGIPGLDYALEWATNLTAPIGWMPVLTNTADMSGTVTFTNAPVDPHNYFRTRFVP